MLSCISIYSLLPFLIVSVKDSNLCRPPVTGRIGLRGVESPDYHFSVHDFSIYLCEDSQHLITTDEILVAHLPKYVVRF